MKDKPKYNPKIHNRRSIRLKGYDYSQSGFYFVTLCCHGRECRFGHIEDGVMYLNEAGKFVNDCWLDIPIHFPNVILHEHIVMPNHIHGIIELIHDSAVGVQHIEPLQEKRNHYQKIIPGSIGAIIRGFKIGVTKWFRSKTDIQKPWQRNYYEHIIRNDESYHTISEYIMNNPTNWIEDTFFPK